jgi:hypothetical protein
MLPENIVPDFLSLLLKVNYVHTVNYHSVSALGSSTGTFILISALLNTEPSRVSILQVK